MKGSALRLGAGGNVNQEEGGRCHRPNIQPIRSRNHDSLGG